MEKLYWMRGLIAGVLLSMAQVLAYGICLPQQQGPYGFCGVVFALPFGFVLNDFLWKIPIVQLRIPVLIMLEIGAFSLVGYFYGRIKVGSSRN